MMGRVLVALGGSDYTLVAIRTAVDLAKRHDAQLTGVTAMNIEKLRRVGAVPMGAGDIANELRDQRVAQSREAAEYAIQQFESACKEAGVRYAVERQEHDEPGHYLIGLSRYHDLTVLGLKSIFDYGVGDSEDPVKVINRLISSGLRPILAVPNEPFEVRRVLVAYSGSMGSAKTMRQFLALELWPDIEVKIVTFSSNDEDHQRLVTDAATYISAHGFRPETEVIDGAPKAGILEAADRYNADLIVMGNSQKSLLKTLVLGETALHVMKNSTKALFLGQ